jgi:hypothetical protein
MRLKAEAAGGGDDVDAWVEATMRGGAPKAGVDSTKEDDREEADARSMGIRSPGGRGRSGRKPAAFREPTAWQGARASADSGRRGRLRITGGRGRGRRERWRLGSMTTTEEVEDTTTTMAANRVRKSGQVLEGEGRCFYI